MVMRSLDAAQADPFRRLPVSSPRPTAAPCLRKFLRLTADFSRFMGSSMRSWFVLPDRAVGKFGRELVFPHRFDGCIQPLARVLDVGLVRNHNRFNIRTPAIFH